MSQPQKQLGRVLDLLIHLIHLAIPGDRRIVPTSPRGSDDRAHELVVRHVVVQRLADPVVEGVVAAAQRLIRSLIAQDGRPFVGEVIGIVGAGRQPIDRAIALVRSGIGQEFSASSRVGSRPAMSMVTRRRKVASSHSAEGGRPSSRSFLKTSSSTKFRGRERLPAARRAARWRETRPPATGS